MTDGLAESKNNIVIFGHGDVGQRIIEQLLARAHPAEQILAVSRSKRSLQESKVETLQVDLDLSIADLSQLQNSNLVFLVPPPAQGFKDSRTGNLLAALTEQHIHLRKIVLISTTGVYGDCGGEWVNEEYATKPQTDRGKRRLDAERQWQAWADVNNIAIVVLRVPGIYARSRLSKDRLSSGVPVVRAAECGYTNRIHADDLAMIIIAAMNQQVLGGVFNASDGAPGKVSEFLQNAALTLGLPSLPEISLAEAQQQLSAGMLSYLSESRKISNNKMLEQLKVALRYPDYRIGLRH